MRVFGDDLIGRNRAEFEQWRRRDRPEKRGKTEALTCVAWALMALHAPWRGLRGGKDGCLLQVPVRAFAARLGVSDRAVSYGFEQLGRLKLLHRKPRQVKHRWFDGKTWHSRADVHSVSYLTVKGVLRLEARAGKTRRLVVGAAGAKRVLTAFGLVGNLLKGAAEKLAVIARRVAASTTSLQTNSFTAPKRNLNEGPTGSRCAERGSTCRPRTLRQGEKNSGGAGMGGDELRLRELWRRGQLFPDAAWPDWWRTLPKLVAYYDKAGRPALGGHTAQHWWGIRECERLARKFQAAFSKSAARELQRP